VKQKLQDITVLGIASKPKSVAINGRRLHTWTYAPQQGKLVASAVNVNLNEPFILSWV